MEVTEAELQTLYTWVRLLRQQKTAPCVRHVWQRKRAALGCNTLALHGNACRLTKSLCRDPSATSRVISATEVRLAQGPRYRGSCTKCMELSTCSVVYTMQCSWLRLCITTSQSSWSYTTTGAGSTAGRTVTRRLRCPSKNPMSACAVACFV